MKRRKNARRSALALMLCTFGCDADAFPSSASDGPAVEHGEDAAAIDLASDSAVFGGDLALPTGDLVLASGDLALASGDMALPNCNLYVSPSGSDTNAGTKTAPLATIQHAVDQATKAANTTTICVLAGIYAERVNIKYAGTASRQLILDGSNGAVVQGGDLFSSGWVQDLSVDPSGCVYKQKVYPNYSSVGMHASLDDKYFPQIRNSLTLTTSTAWIDILKNGPSTASTFSGTATASWNCTPGMYALLHDPQADTNPNSTTLDPRHNMVYVRLAPISGYDCQSPNGKNLRFAPKDRGTFDLTGSSYVTVRGFTVRGGWTNIYVHDASNNNVIESNQVGNSFEGIYLRGSTSDATVSSNDNQIRGNHVSMEYPISLDPDSPLHWNIWQAFKLQGMDDVKAISFLNVGDRNEIHDNQLYEVFDGIDGPITADGRDNKIYRNHIERTIDDGMRPGACGQDMEIFENDIIDSYSPIRLDGDFGGEQGPIWIYRNRIRKEKDLPAADDYCIYFTNGTTTAFHIYHNSCSTGDWGIIFADSHNPAKSANVGFPNTELIDNIWSTPRAYTMYNYAAFFQAPLPKWDYNFTAPGVSDSFIGPHNVNGGGTPLWPLTSVPSDFSPPAGAKVIGAGLTLDSSYKGLGGFYVGTTPDIGAFQVAD